MGRNARQLAGTPVGRKLPERNGVRGLIPRLESDIEGKSVRLTTPVLRQMIEADHAD
jgi:hypothetical protein